jgi:hypothetical protein
MLDFFLVLGQIPGTHIDLTFAEIATIYSAALISYLIRREYRIATQAISMMSVMFWLDASRPKLGRPPKKTVLWPAHINLAPLVNIDFDRYFRLLRQLPSQYLDLVHSDV